MTTPSTTLPSTMTAAVLHRLGEPLRLDTVAVPQPGPGQILIRVTACGACHSDVHAVDGDWDPPPVLPLIPGHEVTGTVVALGQGVQDLAVGDAVGVPWMFWSCGRCEFCMAGMETICLRTQATGYTVPGGYAEFMVAPADFCAVLPPGVDPVTLAPVLCAGVTTYRGLRRTGARAGQWIAVIGIGGLGHIAIQYARAMGLRVLAVDIDAAKLELARSYGAEALVDGRQPDPVAAARAATDGGVHAALVTAVATTAFQQGIAVLRPGGTVAFIGLPGGERDRLTASISAIVNGELSVRGSNVGTRQDLTEAVAFAARGLVQPRVETAPLSACNAVLERLRRGQVQGRVVLVVDPAVARRAA